ncbi:hypothetical protein MC885_006594 [Smutsia gigantea]|nr:hypothetical protein MC885_006594 [Smutsia gigantea]
MGLRPGTAEDHGQARRRGGKPFASPGHAGRAQGDVPQEAARGRARPARHCCLGLFHGCLQSTRPRSLNPSALGEGIGGEAVASARWQGDGAAPPH